MARLIGCSVDKKKSRPPHSPKRGHNTVTSSFITMIYHILYNVKKKGAHMKVKVIVSYIDKHTREYCGLGDVLEYDKEKKPKSS